jgi:hypothetical protein
VRRLWDLNMQGRQEKNEWMHYVCWMPAYMLLSMNSLSGRSIDVIDNESA